MSLNTWGGGGGKVVLNPKQITKIINIQFYEGILQFNQNLKLHNFWALQNADLFLQITILVIVQYTRHQKTDPDLQLCGCITVETDIQWDFPKTSRAVFYQAQRFTSVRLFKDSLVFRHVSDFEKCY